MRIALLESYYGGSHRAFADGLIAHSCHEWRLFTLPDRHWKWRMHDASATLTSQLIKSAYQPDLVLCTSLMDVAATRGYLHQAGLHVPVVVYFHENQLAYPINPEDKDARTGYDNHYAYINYSSARVADGIAFNSAYNRDSFLDKLPQFLTQFPDGTNSREVRSIQEKTQVIPVGLHLDAPSPKPQRQRPLVLWNHRWAYDKGPNLFFETLMELSQKGLAFDLAVAGPSNGRAPEVFAQAKVKLTSHITHWGPASRDTYLNLLQHATILPVTSEHDFFGIAVLEAVHHGVRPLLPNRLVYPEHFNDPNLFWSSSSSFKDLLAAQLRSPVPCPVDAMEIPGRYSWHRVAPRFDQYFASFVA